MGLDFYHVFPGVSIGGPHDGVEHFINGLSGFRIDDVPVVQVVRFKLGKIP